MIKLLLTENDILNYSKPFIVKTSDEKKYLLSKFNKEFFLIKNECPHNGLPLKFARFFDNGKLICKWHGCTFSIFKYDEIPLENVIKSYKVEQTIINNQKYILLINNAERKII